MALANAIAGSLRPSQTVTWSRSDDTAEDLSGATLTGKIRLHGQPTAQAIAGTLTITSAAAGVFRWDYAAGDVAVVGTHEVQFTATFLSGQTPAKTFVTEWQVSKSL